MAKTDNMIVRDNLKKLIYEIVKEKSNLKGYPSSAEADNAFSFEPKNIIKQIEKIEFFSGNERKKKTVEIDDVILVKDYPPNHSQLENRLPYLDLKEWEVTGHVHENPDVKFRVRITAFGQGYVGENKTEISITPSFWIERGASCQIE